jgi:CRP-like cAMP-binding protein
MYLPLQQEIESTIERSLTREELDSLPRYFRHHNVPKHHLINIAGEVCTETYFILKGACYSYYTDFKGQRHVLRLAVENMWIGDLTSFFSGRPSKWSIETLEPVEYLSITNTDTQRSYDELSFMDRYFRVRFQYAYIAIQERLSSIYADNAEERYKAFAREFPDLLQRFPQYIIASYLGVQPESLSRIRRKLAQN